MAKDKGVKKSTRHKKDRRELPEDPSDVQMSLSEHLEELRWRLIYALIGLAVAMALCLAFSKFMLQGLEYSYNAAMADLGQPQGLNIRHPTEAFTRFLMVGLVAGIVVSSPWIFYQLWMFVAAGLYPRERKYVTYAVPFSSVLFIAGAAFFLLVVLRQVMKFFLGFSIWLGWRPQIMATFYISFVLKLTIVFGLAFQLPLAVLILAKMGIVSVRTLHHYRRHVVVGILISAAFLSPPDPFSQLALALPMWILYELGVVLVYFLVARKQKEPED